VTLGAMEVVGLVGLTVLPSHSHKTFRRHREFVVMFLTGSIAMMIISTLIDRSCQIRSEGQELRLIRIRMRLAKLMAGTTLVMTYLYYRHNAYCEPYVYSFFCLAEYVVIVINMSYHLVGAGLMVANARSVVKGDKFEA